MKASSMTTKSIRKVESRLNSSKTTTPSKSWKTTKVESERLAFLRHNQKQIRAEEYKVLKDAMEVDGNPDNHGKLTILPSNFTGGPRYMHQKTQDAMVYVRNYGRPHLFITFGFSIHEHYPLVVQLAVHLENAQRVYFNPDDTNLRERLAAPPKSTLTAFFDLCNKPDERDFTSNLLYAEVPKHYVWNATRKVFTRRNSCPCSWEGLHSPPPTERVLLLEVTSASHKRSQIL